MAIDITAAVPGQPLSVLKHVMAYPLSEYDGQMKSRVFPVSGG